MRTASRQAKTLTRVCSSAAATRRAHDGYRWGGFSETVLPVPVMNVHVQTTAKDWTYFMVAGAPGVISVSPDSEYDSLDTLVAAAKTRPGTINAGASAVGGIWHTKLLALEKAAGIRFNFIPYDGSNPSQLALLSGEVGVVLTSISEQAEMIKANKLRPLAMVEAADRAFPRRMAEVRTSSSTGLDISMVAPSGAFPGDFSVVARVLTTGPVLIVANYRQDIWQAFRRNRRK